MCFLDTSDGVDIRQAYDLRVNVVLPYSRIPHRMIDDNQASLMLCSSVQFGRRVIVNISAAQHRSVLTWIDKITVPKPGTRPLSANTCNKPPRLVVMIGYCFQIAPLRDGYGFRMIG